MAYEAFSHPFPYKTSLVAQMVKRLSTMRETRVRSLGREDSLEKEMATHSSTLAWKIPWTEEPGTGRGPYKFARRQGRQRGVGRGRGGAGGHGRERAFFQLWLDHRRCSSGLRDKTWQLLWKSGQQPWGHSPASQLSPPSGSCRLVWSGGDGVGKCHPPAPLIGGSLANSMPDWLRPSTSSQNRG